MGIRLLSVLCLTLTVALGQQSDRLIVSAEPKDHAAEAVERDDISVEVNKKPARLAWWTPLAGDQAQLQLYIVIDESDDTTLGVQFGDLKNFINSQPATTQHRLDSSTSAGALASELDRPAAPSQSSSR